MARSRPNDSCLGVALPALLALLALSTAAAAAQPFSDQNKCNENVKLDADSFEADYKGNTTQFKNVVISQCDIRVAAKHASSTGLNFENSHWTLDGDVRIDVENRGSLRSEQAVVDFRNNQISKATITGSPAEFEQRASDSGALARGHAGEIVYEVGPGTVRLANDAWIKYGTSEMKGSNLVYDIRNEYVKGSSQPGANEQVHIRIKPTKSAGSDNAPPAEPESASPPKTP